MANPHLLLVHGANHGSWCWAHLLPHLQSRGFITHTLDLPGRERTKRSGWSYRLSEYAETVVEATARIETPVIAVGHSMGGMVISAAAQLRPEQFSRLVFLTAFLPSNGDTMAALGSLDKASKLQKGIRLSALDGRVTILPGPGAEVFFGDCTKEQQRWAFERLSTEPLRPSLDKVRLTPDRFGAVPRSYIRCTQDQALSIALQDNMLARQVCEKIATLNASHSPFLSMPEPLAEAIAAVA
ncbi:MAG: alpha/beta fold hydrolase [Hyphomonadaceae bacterium JAD_PAG50586_4]|nr:MAG: alpha/beta fold hydrolase [Hyphomonadaceae bacterium JAD_PAG50586_4]